MRHTSELGNYSDLLGQDRACWSPVPPTPGHVSLCPVTHHHDGQLLQYPRGTAMEVPRLRAPRETGTSRLKVESSGPGVLREKAGSVRAGPVQGAHLDGKRGGAGLEGEGCAGDTDRKSVV